MLGASYPAICKAGDAVVYDYRCMHRGMQNVSVSTERPMLQFLYTTWCELTCWQRWLVCA